MGKKNHIGVDILSVLASVFVICIVIMVVVFLNSSNESYVSGGSNSSRASVLECVSSLDLDNVVFSYGGSSAEHRLKVIFDNGIFDKINYTYTGNFSNENDASAVLSQMHATYNTYMGSTGVYHEDLFPTFTNTENKGIINIYITNKTFTPGTAKLVFLDNNEYTVINKMSISELSRLYEEKGFSCQFSE